MKYILSIFLLSSCVFAEVIRVEVPASFEATKGFGIVMNAAGSLQIEAKNLAGSNGRYIISFEVNTKDQEDLLVSAVVLSDNGDIAVAPVQPFYETRRIVGEIPDCADLSAQTLRGDVGLIQNLVVIREKRFENRQVALSKVLTPELLQKINKYEGGFGLPHTKDFTAELSPDEMVLRLRRLSNALKNFNNNRPVE